VRGLVGAPTDILTVEKRKFIVKVFSQKFGQRRRKREKEEVSLDDDNNAEEEEKKGKRSHVAQDVHI